MSEPTLEVDGKTYALASATMHSPQDTFHDRHGRSCSVVTAAPWLDAKTSDPRARALVDKGAMRCRVDLGGLAYTGYVTLTGWSAGFSSVDLRVHHIQPIPAAPATTLDETTNPADVEWGEVRSAVAAKDWRRAWEVVGTDHEGEATPGEVYIFGNARRVSAVSAALMAWRGVALPIQTMMLRHVEVASDVETHAVRKMVARKFSTVEAWARIKAIAAWESSAAAQYVEPKAKRARAWLAERTISTPRTVGGPFGGHAATVIIDDPPPVTGLFRNPWVDPSPSGDEILLDLRAMQELANAPTRYALTVNGERQTYNVPASAIPDIAGALRDYIGQPLTAARVAVVESTVRRVTQDTARVASGNAAISPNPAPHGPNRRRRR